MTNRNKNEKKSINKNFVNSYHPHSSKSQSIGTDNLIMTSPVYLFISNRRVKDFWLNCYISSFLYLGCLRFID